MVHYEKPSAVLLMSFKCQDSVHFCSNCLHGSIHANLSSSSSYCSQLLVSSSVVLLEQFAAIFFLHCNLLYKPFISDWLCISQKTSGEHAGRHACFTIHLAQGRSTHGFVLLFPSPPLPPLSTTYNQVLLASSEVRTRGKESCGASLRHGRPPP